MMVALFVVSLAFPAIREENIDADKENTVQETIPFTEADVRKMVKNGTIPIKVDPEDGGDSQAENRVEMAPLDGSNQLLLETRPITLDYYDYMSLPKQEEEEIPVLPDQTMNINEDYAGIYDYRGSHDGRFRRKRTLTTNLEQLITRSSRLSRTRRSVNDNMLDQPSPADQAENLFTLLTALSDADPSFNVQDFIKVLDEPSIGEQDLEYLLFLSNLASEKEHQQQIMRPPVDTEAADTFDIKDKEMPNEPHEMENAWPRQMVSPPIDIAPVPRVIADKDLAERMADQPSQMFNLPLEHRFRAVTQTADNKRSSKRTNYGQLKERIPPSVPQPDLSRLYALASLLAQQDDANGIAM